MAQAAEATREGRYNTDVARDLDRPSIIPDRNTLRLSLTRLLAIAVP